MQHGQTTSEEAYPHEIEACESVIEQEARSRVSLPFEMPARF
jgi:hypothetical protein